MLPGFEHIARLRDDHHKIWLAKIHPGEMCVTASTEAVTTIIGSCVAACVRDTRTGVGGMNHFMLPPAAAHADEHDGVDAMERLVNAVLAHGCGERARLELKLVGGSLLSSAAPDTGTRAIHFARRFAAAARLTVVAEDVGGLLGRDVIYWPGTGQLQIRKLRGIQTLLAEREHEYRLALVARRASLARAE
jgi:chemotaxis protein CheD